MKTGKALLFYMGLLLALSVFLVLSAAARLHLVVNGSDLTLVWFFTGASLSVLLLFGLRYWPAVFIASACFSYFHGMDLPHLTGTALTEALGALLGAFALKKSGFRNYMDRSRDFILLATIPPAVSLLGNIPAASHTQPHGWLVVFLAQTLGLLMATPFILSWWTRMIWGYSKRRAAEGLSGILGLSLATLVVFYQWIQFSRPVPPFIVYAIFPIFLWIHYTMGLRGSSLATMAMLIIAFEGTRLGLGPIARGMTADLALLERLWICFGVVLGSNYFTAAVVSREKWRSDTINETKVFFKTALENSVDIVTICDANGTLRYESPAIKPVLGYTQEELIGRNAFELIHPEDLPIVLAKFKEGILNPGSAQGAEFRFKAKNGEWRYLSTTGRSLLSEPAVAGILLTSRDMTDRIHFESELRKLSLAIEQIPVAVMITDVSGDIEYVNPKFEEQSGYSLQESLGKNPRFLKSGETTQEEYKQFWDTILSGRMFKGEFKNRRKNGQPYTEASTVVPVMDSRGRVTHFVAVKEDVTERRLLEEQFRQSQKMEAVGRLAGGIAHDFNNILTVMTGYCELFLMKFDKDSGDYQDMLEIKQATARATVLTRQLLAFSRRQVFNPKVLELNEVVRNLDKIMRRIVGESVELVLDLGADLRPVRIDPGQIEQAAMNLVVNARDAVQHGGKIVVRTRSIIPDKTLRLKFVPTAERAVLLEIEDTGVGMTEEVKAHLFEPFFTTKEKGKGTGLGLSTVHGIVLQSGGAIDVQSKVGQGTTIRIYFPESKETAEETQSQKVDALPRGHECVLVVEDELVVRNLASRILKEQGYEVLEAGDGTEALRIIDASQDKIDLMITDLVMPLMGGKELVDKLRGKCPRMRIILMSGYTDLESLRRGEFGTNQKFMQKPFTPRELLEIVRHFLDEK